MVMTNEEMKWNQIGAEQVGSYRDILLHLGGLDMLTIKAPEPSKIKMKTLCGNIRIEEQSTERLANHYLFVNLQKMVT
ncbi:MAG: hypothetical protein ACJ70S_01470 [Nitrososphaera sp.]